jgi:hypothetical protein
VPLDVNAKVNINKFYDVARTDIASLINGAAIDSAVIFNDSGKPVKFYVYNYIDTIFLVSAQKTLVASDHYGQVAASGKFFKIHPDDDKDAEFLVAPGKAYVYRGPGKIETVES